MWQKQLYLCGKMEKSMMIFVLVLYPMSYTRHFCNTLIYHKREYKEQATQDLITEPVFLYQLLTKHTYCFLSNHLMLNIPHKINIKF